MSLWIESHQSLLNHRKTLRVCAALGIPRVQLFGHLHMLWWWALDNANEDGFLGDISAVEIAAAAEWPINDADNFVEALLAAGRPHGFLELKRKQYVLHDWRHYAGKLAAQRRANAERMKRTRSENVQRTPSARRGARGEGGEDIQDIEERRGEESARAAPLRPASPRSGDSDDWDFSLSLFQTNIGELDTRTRNELRGLFDQVPDKRWVLAAINQASTAERPGFGYVKRTLEDCIKTGVAPSSLGRAAVPGGSR